MTELSQTPALSGREISRARRLEMSRTGAAKFKSTGGRSRGAARAKTKAVSAPPVVMSEVGEQRSSTQPVEPARVVDTPPVVAAAPVMSTGVVKQLSGAAFSRARRAKLAKGGKSALASSSSVKDGARVRSRSRSDVGNAASIAPSSVVPKAQKKGDACCEACAEGGVTESSVNDVALDGLCEIIEGSPQASIDASSSVRAFCRDRRNTLSQKGKLGLPGKAGREARKSLIRGAGNSSALTGRTLAMLSRRNRSEVGRGDKPKGRPSGRVRPTTAPPKVETGTTLSGQAVSGTQVEQTDKITGAEAGGCRAITGTEYLGAEQYNKLCSTIPQPAEAKVAVSETTRGQFMTGSNIAANDKVTGAETGGCKEVTGSEYLGVEHFKSVCATSGVVPSQSKVIEGRTNKDMSITGVDEARDNAVTGSESGSSQHVTGSDYVDRQQKNQTTVAPAKVAFSHTISGMPVSGGESSRTSGITGDEQDSNGRVTGSEYVSSERFQSAQGSKSAMTVPAKVGVDSSRSGMTITGNLVDRDEKVTGNEPGTCQRVTGNQYDNSAKKGFCDQRSSKVSEMHTLHGRPLTGTEVNHSPKLTGDDRGNCSVVTGTEYVSQEGFQQSCSQAPIVGAEKTGLSHTWNNQIVSGAKTGHSGKTTGDEQGICNTVTGDNYAGREQVSEFCAAPAVIQNEQRLRHSDSVQAVSGIAPGMDERLVGNFKRGQCQSISGTPYQGLGHQEASLCAQSVHPLARAPLNQGRNEGLMQSNQSAQSEVVPYQADFTILSPAKAAWQQRDRQQSSHSSVFGVESAVTGVLNKAQGMISGTPEFRHPQEMNAASVAPIVESSDVQLERITGEGSVAGMKITGDDWSRGSSMTGTEGLISSRRNQTRRGFEPAEHNKIGAHALKDREAVVEVSISKVTGGNGGSGSSTLVTLSGGAVG